MRLDLDPWAIFGCNIAKWTILCIVVHFQPVIKLLQKGVRVHQKRVILMQKNAKWGGGHPLPTPHPLGTFGTSILTPPILKICLRYWFFLNILCCQRCKPDISKKKSATIRFTIGYDIIIKCSWRCFFLADKSFNGLKHLTEKSDSSGITDSCSGCGRPHNAPTATINKVKDLALIFWSMSLYPIKTSPSDKNILRHWRI